MCIFIYYHLIIKEYFIPSTHKMCFTKCKLTQARMFILCICYFTHIPSYNYVFHQFSITKKKNDDDDDDIYFNQINNFDSTLRRKLNNSMECCKCQRYNKIIEKNVNVM